jgi:hypothetical protein
MRKFLCVVATAAILVGCGGKKQPHAEVTSGGVFAPEVLADTVQAEPITGKAFTIDVPADWRTEETGVKGDSCVLHLRKAPYTKVSITTAPKLKPEDYVAQREKEGCIKRSDQEVYGRVFTVYDRMDSEKNIILSVGTPFEDGMFVMTLKAGPQRLPMEETHTAMYENMKTLLQRIVFR